MIVRHSFASKIGSTVDVNGKPHKIVRPVFWKRALILNPSLREDSPWKFFYYEVEPIEKTTSKETIREESNSRASNKTSSPHSDDLRYEALKKRVDAQKYPLINDIKRQPKRLSKLVDPFFAAHRRNLLQFDNYMSADHWTLSTNGPCSFFIKGYKWPWHTRRDYRGLLFVTDAAPNKKEKLPL